MVHTTSQVGRGDIRQRLTTSLHLKPGQLITGKAVKFFPNQHAQIQVGNMSLFAQLDTALQANQTYLFQVVSVDQKPLLKKIAEVANNRIPVETVKQLGMPIGKETEAIVRQLIDKNIAFTKPQLDSIHALLKKYGNDSIHREVALHMVEKGLPLTEETFLSIRTNKTQSFRHLVESLQEILSAKKSSEMVDLRSHLAVYLKDGHSHVKQAALLSFFDKYVDRITPLLEQQASFSAQQLRSIFQHPENQNFSVVKDKIHQLIDIQLSGSKSETHSLEMLYKRIMGRLSSQMPISNTDLTLLQQHPMTQKIMLKTSGDERRFFEQLTSSQPSRIQETLQYVRSILDQQLPTETTKMLRLLLLQMDGLDRANQFPAKERFLQHLQHFIQSSGVTDESQLLHSTAKQEVLSLKQALMLHLPQATETAVQRMEQLVHWITGVQVANTTIQNDPYLTHSFQLPGNSFGLDEDIHLEFQSKKNKNGELDPDYCRILFDLTLANIGKTMIALGVQKRVVTITIFNDQDEHAKTFVPHWKGYLEKQLNNLDYRLSTINWKPLLNESEPTKKSSHLANPVNLSNKKGFDWRI